MQVVEVADANRFHERCDHFLRASEAENNLLLSASLALQSTAYLQNQSPKARFFTIESKASVHGCALTLDHRYLLLSTASAEIGQILAHEFCRRRVRFHRSFGSRMMSGGFAAGYHDAGFQCLVLRQNQLAMRMMPGDRKMLSALSPGFLRPARASERALLIEWSLALSRESGLEEPIADTITMIDRLLENQTVFIWYDQEPVAMAALAGISLTGVRIQMVYTDPKKRNKGYATSTVWALCDRIARLGLPRVCYLYVANTNIQAQSIYENLGFSQVGEPLEVRMMA